MHSPHEKQIKAACLLKLPRMRPIFMDNDLELRAPSTYSMASLDVSVLQQELHDLRARQREVRTRDRITVTMSIGSTL